MKYEWYKVINNSEEITQGDIIRNCPVLKIDTTIPDNIHEIKAEVGFIDAVVMTQAFARFFMRIGLPSDIPSFKKKKGT
jgi:hypothetical protein